MTIQIIQPSPLKTFFFKMGHFCNIYIISRQGKCDSKERSQALPTAFLNGSITPDLSDQFLCDTSTRNKCQCKLIYCFHKPVHTYETRTRCRCRLMLERLPNELGKNLPLLTTECPTRHLQPRTYYSLAQTR